MRKKKKIEGRLEKTEENTSKMVLICKEEDFKTAIYFSELARNNALSVFNRLSLPTEYRNREENRKTEMSKAQFKTEIIEKAIKMQKEGKSLNDIAVALCAKKSTIQDWLK